jgi:hypothetical protein
LFHLMMWLSLSSFVSWSLCHHYSNWSLPLELCAGPQLSYTAPRNLTCPILKIGSRDGRWTVTWKTFGRKQS